MNDSICGRRTVIVAVLVTFFSLSNSWGQGLSALHVTTLAGTAYSEGMADGQYRAASFFYPMAVAAEPGGSFIVADAANHAIRRVTLDGVVTTVAGRGIAGFADGPGHQARFRTPSAVAVDLLGNVLVADTGNHVIRRISVSGEVTTLAGVPGRAGSNNGAAMDAHFSSPGGIAVDSAGNVYVADSANHVIRLLRTDQTVVTLAGRAGYPGNINGMGVSARFSYPVGLTIDAGWNLFVADSENDAIRKVTPDGTVTTILSSAGSPPSRLDGPHSIALAGEMLLFTETEAHVIRSWSPSEGVKVIAGQLERPGTRDGTDTEARFYYPSGIAINGNGVIAIADTFSSTVRLLSSGVAPRPHRRRAVR